MRYYISTLLIYFSCMLEAQETIQPSFIPPFDFPIVFSGNFGELRADHFHGGLDFKTQGAIGKKVRALADGYVSRIRVTHGSGYVLDVVYDNGYTTINRHLSAFVGDMAEEVEKLQYEQNSWEVDIKPSPDRYPVKAGQVIALSGNTGYSFGPHLHLDVIETASGEYVDPLPFFADKVKDNTPPRAMGLIFFPQPGKGVVMGSRHIQKLPLQPKQPITAWGEIGVGIRAYDYMDGVHNRYGVKEVLLEVDGVEVFYSVVDRFLYEENPYINSWAYNGQYMKSFVEPGNRLRMLQAKNDNRGLITIDEERPYHFVYTLTDALGNASKVRFTVHGKPAEIAPIEHRDKYFFRWNKSNYLQEPGLDLLIPRGMLYDNVWLDYAMHADSGALAFTYQLNKVRTPLHGYCDLRIALRHKPLEDSTKYYVASVNENGTRSSVGGHYRKGAMEARIRRLGTYTVAIDTVPPVLTPVNQQQWGKTGRIVFKARDKETGIATYKGSIDGKYALFGKPNSINGSLVCQLDAKHVKRGGKHLLVMSVTDGCGNVTTEEYTFVW